MILDTQPLPATNPESSAAITSVPWRINNSGQDTPVYLPAHMTAIQPGRGAIFHWRLDTSIFANGVPGSGRCDCPNFMFLPFTGRPTNYFREPIMAGTVYGAIFMSGQNGTAFTGAIGLPEHIHRNHAPSHDKQVWHAV